MKIESIKMFLGANIYHSRPVLMMRLDLEELSGKQSWEAADFNVRLLELLPGLRKHYCDACASGGFVRRLHKGTHFNHVVEHVVIELLALAGLDERDRKICNGDEQDDSKVVVETTSVETTRYLLPVGAELVESVLAEKSFFLEEKIAEARRIAANAQPSAKGRVMVGTAGQHAVL